MQEFLDEFFAAHPPTAGKNVFMTGGLGLSTYRQLVSGENLPAQEGSWGAQHLRLTPKERSGGTRMVRVPKVRGS